MYTIIEPTPELISDFTESFSQLYQPSFFGKREIISVKHKLIAGPFDYVFTISSEPHVICDEHMIDLYLKHGKIIDEITDRNTCKQLDGLISKMEVIQSLRRSLDVQVANMQQSVAQIDLPRDVKAQEHSLDPDRIEK